MKSCHRGLCEQARLSSDEKALHAGYLKDVHLVQRADEEPSKNSVKDKNITVFIFRTKSLAGMLRMDERGKWDENLQAEEQVFRRAVHLGTPESHGAVPECKPRLASQSTFPLGVP